MTSSELMALATSCRRAVLSAHNVSPIAVLLLKPHTARKVGCVRSVCVPRMLFSRLRAWQEYCREVPCVCFLHGQTTSGKIARRHNRIAFLERLSNAEVRAQVSGLVCGSRDVQECCDRAVLICCCLQSPWHAKSGNVLLEAPGPLGWGAGTVCFVCFPRCCTFA
jgi:hypothetical protein